MAAPRWLSWADTTDVCHLGREDPRHLFINVARDGTSWNTLDAYAWQMRVPAEQGLLLNGEVMGSVVRNGSRQPDTWTAELLEDLPPNRRPAPFREIEHDLPTLEDLCSWLGNPQVKANRRESEPL